LFTPCSRLVTNHVGTRAGMACNHAATPPWRIKQIISGKESSLDIKVGIAFSSPRLKQKVLLVSI
jgi:hypothetical protein